MNEIKPWQDRVKPGAFTGVKMEAMLAEIAEHRAAKVEQGEPVAWQYRTELGDGQLSEWTDCQKSHHDAFKRVPLVAGWHYEARALFALPSRPMSDEQIDAIPFTGFIPVSERGHSETEALRIFARLVEAHIKGATA